MRGSQPVTNGPLPIGERGWSALADSGYLLSSRTCVEDKERDDQLSLVATFHSAFWTLPTTYLGRYLGRQIAIYRYIVGIVTGLPMFRRTSMPKQQHCTCTRLKEMPVSLLSEHSLLAQPPKSQAVANSFDLSGGGSSRLGCSRERGRLVADSGGHGHSHVHLTSSYLTSTSSPPHRRASLPPSLAPFLST